MAINIYTPENVTLRPVITVFGVGGAGGNAVNNMVRSKLEGVRFIAANTDAQALEQSLANHKLQLGMHLTKGLGAGANPEIGSRAAEETEQEIRDLIKDSNMVFITAGMGGGTGTGAAPVIAKVAKEVGILTIGVVTRPFNFEGEHRAKLAEQGIKEMSKYADTLIIIPNQNLFRVATAQTTFMDAFKIADEVLHDGVRGVTDLIILPGLVNLDFADIKTVMSEMGAAVMGTGEATGEDRAVKAAEAAILNPILESTSMRGAKGVLINITGGSDMTLFEVDEAANRIREEVDNKDAKIIFGSTFSNGLSEKIRVSVVATGIGSAQHEYKKSCVVTNEAAMRADEAVVEFDDLQEEQGALERDVYASDSSKERGGFFGKLTDLFKKQDTSGKRSASSARASLSIKSSYVENDIYDKPAILRQKSET